MPTSERLVTPEELSEMLQIPLGTIYQWRARRTGPPAHKVGKHLRYRQSDVEDWLAKQREVAAP